MPDWIITTTVGVGRGGRSDGTVDHVASNIYETLPKMSQIKYEN
jgi:hypothetical protein